MAGITIAVPVFNGGAYLARTLQAIRRQSYGDFRVLIYDNASTDDTPAIARQVMSEDDRFTYVRQDQNKGALANFVDALMAAETPYFLWRAVDDSWDDNYLAVLFALLEANQSAHLAVGVISSTDLDDIPLRRMAFRPRSSLAWQVLGIHPSWIYGLFRREALTARVQQVWRDYAHPWAWDHLTLLPFILDRRVAGTRETVFHQLIRRSIRHKRLRPRVQPDLRLMIALRQRFATMARGDIDTLVQEPSQQRLLRLVLPIYIGKRVYRLRRIWYRSLQARITGQPLTTSVNEHGGFESYY